jgi:predicted hydrocarbon binding protein
MASPEVPIDVDPETGIWRTDGLPMVYLPRHFLVNNHVAIEEALGRDAYRAILHTATEKSAIHWCRAEAKTHNLSAEATFRHYFKRLSQRGWGQFSVDQLDTQARRGEISLRNSVFALEAKGDAPLCYMFEGFMTGAFRFLLEAEGQEAAVSCTETHCAGDSVHSDCSFSFAGGTLKVGKM